MNGTFHSIDLEFLQYECKRRRQEMQAQANFVAFQSSKFGDLLTCEFISQEDVQPIDYLCIAMCPLLWIKRMHTLNMQDCSKVEQNANFYAA